MSSSGEENCSQSPTMQFLEEPKPHEQPSVSTPSTSNIPSNPPASPSQPLIASNPSPPQALMASNSSPPPVPQPPTMNPLFQALSTPTPRPPPPQRFANYQDNDSYFNSFPPGYRFRPYDYELVLHYLYNKVKGLPLPMNRIINVDLYQFDPEDLAAQYSHHGEKEWYFFTPRNRKYRNGNRPNRAAGGGYWKATGADKGITIYKKSQKKSNAGTNVRNPQSNEEIPLLTIDDDDEDYINDHDYDPNHLSAIEASFAGEIYGMVTNSLENPFPIRDELSQQQTGTSIVPDANNYFFMLQDSQIPGLEETFGTPTPMDSINPEDRSSEQMGLQDEFLNPTYSSSFNIPDPFSNLYSIIPTNLPLNPSPLVNICPVNTAPIRSLPPMNIAPSTGDLPPINIDPLAAPFPPANPANSQPSSEIMNAAPNHPGEPPQHR
uniref:NAC domain-containing protein 78-like n=1 Tax=Populus alba TaxID=43335 RepID=A0A4U5QZE4_POPAL|nr:NAC domain-containing protein 78-like [Populus alba]